MPSQWIVPSTDFMNHLRRIDDKTAALLLHFDTDTADPKGQDSGYKSSETTVSSDISSGSTSSLESLKLKTFAVISVMKWPVSASTGWQSANRSGALAWCMLHERDPRGANNHALADMFHPPCKILEAIRRSVPTTVSMPPHTQTYA
jgi:hypothetical protein